MRILAVEFSSEQRNVAVARVIEPAGTLESQREATAGSHRQLQAGEFAGKMLALRAVEVLGAAQEKGGRSVKALTMVEAALAQARVSREQIECIAVGLGPGSYTGIRAAISLAWGWQLAREVRVAGVSSVDALAVEAQSLGVRGEVSFAIDAQRGEFYVARYLIMEASLQVIEPLHIVSHSKVLECISQQHRVMGPDRIPGAETQLLYPSAAAVARLAAGLNEEGTTQNAECGGGETLEPIYLRDAQFVKAPPARVSNDQ